jgi:REP element-mobilizing transposase RayT
MANTYHRIYLQTVFAVKYRNAVIDKTWKEKLFAVIGNLINETKCKTIIVNGVEDHVHCFIGLKPVVSVSELMKTVKAKSSKYINDHSLSSQHFEWQEACLPVGRVTVFFLTVKKMLILFISIFSIRRSIIKPKHSVMSI